MSGFIKVDFQLKFKDKGYRGLLKKLQTFLKYSATVGVHQSDGKKRVARRYTAMSSGKSRISGRSSIMTIAKLAYQNEFGATIRIKPRYRTASSTVSKTYNTLTQKISTKTTSRYSALRNANEQGYLLLDKSGKFVAYFKPNSKIRIPERSFIRKVIKDNDPKVEAVISDILQNTFIKGGYTSHKAIEKVAKIIQYKIKNNIKNSSPKNHPLTVKAKGKNSPLVDEQDRITNAIKYKIYKNAFIQDSKSNIQYRYQTSRVLNKLLASANQYNQIVPQTTTTTNVFNYKTFNPNL